MKKYSVLIMTGILSLALVFGLALVGCPLDGDDGGGGDPPGIQPLPEIKGNNALEGKTYFEGNKKTEFVENKKYTVFSEIYGDDGPVLKDGKYTYTTTETGSYAWDADAKTVTTKPEKVAIQDNGEYGELLSPSEYRAAMEENTEEHTKNISEADLKATLASMGFSSLNEYHDYWMNEDFSNTTYAYSLSTDTKALFLEEQLPANGGINELADQPYNGMSWNDKTEKDEKNTNMVYTFAADGTYAFVDNTTSGSKKWPETGKYSVDSKHKWVYLQPTKVGGKDRETFYSEYTAYNNHGYPDDNACRAAETNNQFSVDSRSYDSTEKTINR
jgi:hypothetical protein